MAPFQILALRARSCLAAWRGRGAPATDSARRDLLAILAGCAVVYLVASLVDAYELVHDFADRHEDWQLDELLTVGFILPFGLALYAARRNAACGREMAHRARAEAEALRLAVHDPLTGLPNRRRLAEVLAAALQSARQDGRCIAVLQIDLDRFKPVNDLHGHAVGDRLLQQVASRLRDTLREEDLVARTGGDEFVVLMVAQQGPAQIGRTAIRLIRALETAFQIDGLAVQIGASIGIAMAPQDGLEAAALQHRADVALYRAKSEGRGGHRFFEAGMDQQAQQAAVLQAELRLAIRDGEIEPHFQPLVDLRSGTLVGFEVLARWQHASRGAIPPGIFIPLAEDSGQIIALTEGILRRACLAASHWPQPLSIAVNMSALHLADRELVERVQQILAETDFPAERLELELTESALIGDLDQARESILRLKRLGLHLSLDDFGTGYSSLTHLRALPFDKIKIDASFVRSLTDHAESRKIVAAVLSLSHSLGLLAVAEGVESVAQAALLNEMGCTIGQGWLFGRAMPAAEVAALLLTPPPVMPAVASGGQSWIH